MKGIDSNNNKQRGDGEADLLIPSLMSLTVSPPRMTSLHLARLRSRAPFPPPNFCPLYSATFQSSPYIYASSTPSLFLHQRCFAIVEVERTNKTRREFAQVAREVTRENFEPPAGTRILFAYYTYPSGKKVRKTSFISLARFSFFIFVLLFCFSFYSASSFPSSSFSAHLSLLFTLLLLPLLFLLLAFCINCIFYYILYLMRNSWAWPRSKTRIATRPKLRKMKTGISSSTITTTSFITSSSSATSAASVTVGGSSKRSSLVSRSEIQPAEVLVND